jgi:DNA modification methylase
VGFEAVLSCERAWAIECGDCLEVLRRLPDECVQTVVTSPPYWGLRDYGVDGQIGLEDTPEEYVQHLMDVFREVRRVLREDGTLWLNLGDSYASGGKGGGGSFMQERRDGSWQHRSQVNGWKSPPPGLKQKDLVGIPWRVAFALQADGWYLRSDIIWAKPNPMPESVTDRPTRSHEYVFLLAKSPRYYYDAAAIREPSATEVPTREPDANGSTITGAPHSRHSLGEAIPAKQRRQDKQRGHSRRHAGFNERWDRMTKAEQCALGRNKRDVWTVPTSPFPEAHFATYPPALIEPCILAGCPEGGIVLDPFNGAGTTGLVALRHGRRYIGIELNPEYVSMSERRIISDAPLLNACERSV